VIFDSALGDLLPLAVGIAISPIPIIAVILILFSANARVNGPLFLLGWVVGVAVLTTAVVLVAGSAGATDAAASGPSLGDLVTLLLGIGAIALGIRQWRSKGAPGEEAKLPGWMSAIAGFSPVRALGFGVLLSALNPKNLAFAVAAGVVIDGAVTAGGNAVAMIALFVVLASLSIVIPVLYTRVGGESARRTLTGWRTWLTAHNAALMAVLFIVIGAKLLGEGLDALL
jgi:threonine/homoserine/homoserine lactone efflux protein